MAAKILGIVGSYRKNGVVDRLVGETLAAAEAAGAMTHKIYLADAHIEFCRNCRRCAQDPGTEPGRCVITDDVAAILEEWKGCTGLVFGAPVNFYNLTALARKFMERLICFGYWPWGQGAPKWRSEKREKKAVLITATGMPSILGRLFTGSPRALRLTAKTMGAEPIQTIFAGMIAQKESVELSGRLIRQARAAGRRLAMGK